MSHKAKQEPEEIIDTYFDQYSKVKVQNQALAACLRYILDTEEMPCKPRHEAKRQEARALLAALDSGKAERCPHCSFHPTSRNDYCDAHRPALDSGKAPADPVQRAVERQFGLDEKP